MWPVALWPETPAVNLFAGLSTYMSWMGRWIDRVEKVGLFPG